MALDASKLEENLLAEVFDSPGYEPIEAFPDDTTKAAETARRWMAAYLPYALDGQSCGGVVNSPIATAQAAAAQVILAAAFVPPQVIPTTVQAIANAIAAFWLNPLIWLPVPPAGPAIVSAVNPGSLTVFIASMSGAWSANAALLPSGQSPSADAVAAQVARDLDTLTKGVTVTHSLTVPPFTCAGTVL